MKKNYEVKTIQPENYPNVALTYAQVFAGEPWQEVSRCSECQSFSGNDPKANAQCKCGGSFSLPAYPLAETTQYVGQELAKPEATGLFLAQVAQRLVQPKDAYGFAWGYQMSPQELTQQKYKTEEMRNIISDLLVKSGFFFYFSEIGVLPDLQGLGMGKILSNRIVDTGMSRGYEQVVVRTNEDSALRYILEKMGMKPILGLQTGIKDTENEARVLFVGQR